MFVAIAMKEDETPKPKAPKYAMSVFAGSPPYWEDFVPSNSTDPCFAGTAEDAAKKLLKQLKRRNLKQEDYEIVIAEVTHKVVPPEPPVVLVPFTGDEKKTA